jgi:hypothetical protein
VFFFFFKVWGAVKLAAMTGCQNWGFLEAA